MKKLLLLAVLLWGSLSLAQAATDFIYLTPVSGAAGSISNISAMMSNPRAKRACAFQCDIVLPEGVSVVLGSLELSDRCPDYVINAKQMTRNSYRILCYSPEMKPVIGVSGEVFSFDVRLGLTMEADVYVVRVMNLVIADDNTVCVFDKTPKEGTSQIMVTTKYTPGDMNQDRIVEAQDIPLWAESMIASDSKGDVNDDGKIDAVDIAVLVDNILSTDY